MLRYIHIICNLLAYICALTSPVVIVHWLSKVSGIVPLQAMVQGLDPVFRPLSDLVGAVIKTPPLLFSGHTYETSPAVLACLLTALFFVFTAVAESAKAFEQGVNVQLESSMQRRRLQKLQEEEQQKAKALSANMQIYVFLDYDVMACPELEEPIERLIRQEDGQIHSRIANEMSLEFRKIEQGLSFVMSVARAIQNHYASSMRPVNQAPFRLSLHGTAGNVISSNVNEARKLARFIGNNQMIVSEAAKALLDASKTNIPYRVQSLGIYSTEEGQQQELFKLSPGTQPSTFR